MYYMCAQQSDKSNVREEEKQRLIDECLVNLFNVELIHQMRLH